MFKMPRQPQTVGQTLDNGFKLFFEGFGRCFLPSLFASLVLVLPYVIAGPLFTAGQPSTGNWATLVSVMIPVWLAYLWLHAAILFRLGRVAQSADSTLTEALTHGFKCLLPILASVILYMIAVMVGTVFLIIPGIFLSLSLYLFMPAIVLDGCGPVQALKRSHNLVWGNWWRTLTVLTVPLFVVLIMYMGIGFVSGLLLAFGNDVVPSELQIMIQLFQAPMNAILMPLLYAIAIVQYHDLKFRREGGDLEARLTTPAMAY
ncbi:MAG TPA: hypothetical protein VJL88_12005 [Nitrospira sp.]|nr:hypothetical protein [Nitrospira sp.]